jgi:putative flippase GtrA
VAIKQLRNPLFVFRGAVGEPLAADDTAEKRSPRSRQLIRFIRYAAGSAIATLVSAVTFAVSYRLLNLGPEVSSVAAFAAGALINFVAYRFWAWARRQRRGLGRDAAWYALLAVGTALVAIGVTTVTDWYVDQAGATPNHQALLVEASYFATYAAMFLVKFVLLDRVIFRARP